MLFKKPVEQIFERFFRMEKGVIPDYFFKRAVRQILPEKFRIGLVDIIIFWSDYQTMVSDCANFSFYGKLPVRVYKISIDSSGFG